MKSKEELIDQLKCSLEEEFLPTYTIDWAFGLIKSGYEAAESRMIAFAEWCADSTGCFIWVNGVKMWKMKDNSYNTTAQLLDKFNEETK